MVWRRYENTERRSQEVEAKGILYLGMGVSGGEEGARNGEQGPFVWEMFLSICEFADMCKRHITHYINPPLFSPRARRGQGSYCVPA